MKTYAFKDSNENVVGIGMVYLENGGFTPEIQKLVDRLGVDGGLLEYGNRVKPSQDYTTIIVDTDNMPGGDKEKFDKTFCGAFIHESGTKVGVHLGKAKEICHARRRMRRDIEMAPFDDAIAKQIPGSGDPGELESARQKIRDKHASIQTTIDAASTIDELKAVIEQEEL